MLLLMLLTKCLGGKTIVDAMVMSCLRINIRKFYMSALVFRHVSFCQNQTTPVLPVLLASEDAFGSHIRIAEAIAQIIKEERGGQAIALARIIHGAA